MDTMLYGLKESLQSQCPPNITQPPEALCKNRATSLNEAHLITNLDGPIHSTLVERKMLVIPEMNCLKKVKVNLQGKWTE